MTGNHEAPVTVLRSGDAALLAVAKSLLEAEKIEYYAKGEGVQDLFAGGRFGTGFSLIAGPIELQVRAVDADRALEILADLASQDDDA